MLSGVVDHDGKNILASCPFYAKNPLCVNSCALFSPYIDDEGIIDYSCGQCGLGNGTTQLLVSLSEEEEVIWRVSKGYDK